MNLIPSAVNFSTRIGLSSRVHCFPLPKYRDEKLRPARCPAKAQDVQSTRKQKAGGNNQVLRREKTPSGFPESFARNSPDCRNKWHLHKEVCSPHTKNTIAGRERSRNGRIQPGCFLLGDTKAPAGIRGSLLLKLKANLASPSPVPVAGARMLFEKVDIWFVNHSRLLHGFAQI